MYNSSYSQAKFGLEARRKIQTPRGKSCGYYMRVVFFFSSLIQSLIIISLVLFLVYGRSPDTAAESRVQDLEKSFNRLSIDNMNLRQQRKNLTLLLNATQTDKMRNNKEIMNLRQMLNKSVIIITSLRDQVNQCDNDKRTCQIQLSMNRCPMPPITQNENQVQQLEQLLKLVSSNFSQTVQIMTIEMEKTANDRNTLTLEAISLRRDKASLQKQLENYRKKCKEDFVQSLGGISNVSKAFLLKIDTLLPKVSPFLLTCEKQRDHMDQIRNNCSSLSREVETKFQHYLDKVSSQVSEIQERSARLQAEKDQLAKDYHWCSQNRSAMALEHQEKLQKTQEKYDREMENLLTDRMRLQGDKELGETAMKVKEGEIKILNDKIRSLNASQANCGSRTGMGSPGATGNTGIGWVGPSAIGQGNRGSTAGTRLMTGIGGWGASVSVTGNSDIGFGNTGMSRAGSSATGVGTRGSGGTGFGGAVPPSGVAKKNGPVLGSSNGYSLANINQYLRELQQYSKPNSGSEVSG